VNVQSVHYWLYHTLSDGDAIAGLHIHDGVVCRHSITKQT